MSSIVVNGCDLYYELRGRGPDLVFVHGEDHGIEMFEQQLERFSAEHRCLAYYRRGHGKSGLPPYGYSLWCQALDLAGLLDALGIECAVIVAVAMGTTIAASYAIDHPARVRGLVLVSWYELDGYPLMERRRQRHSMTFAELHLKIHEIMKARGAEGLIEYMTREGDAFLPILPRDARVREKVIRMMASHPIEHYVKAAEFYSSMPNLVPRMKAIECPVLGICGEDDPSPDRPELLGGLRDFREVWIPGARRFSLLERPDAFNDALGAFLGSLPA